MKQIVILVGSARNGNSLFIAHKLQMVLSREKLDIINIAKKNIHNCTGCLECDETHKCFIDDDMNDVIPMLLEADTIIAVTPVRWGLLSGDLKVFLDRLNPLATTGELEDKKFICISIGQSDKNDNSIEHSLASLEFFSESAGMKLLGKFPVYNCLAENDLDVSGYSDYLCCEIEKIVRNSNE